MYGDEGEDTLDARDNEFVADILDGGNGTDSGWWTEAEDTDTDMEGNFSP